jgi:hypothetical protein
VRPPTSPSRAIPSPSAPRRPSGPRHAHRPGRGRRGITTGLTERADAATGNLREQRQGRKNPVVLLVVLPVVFLVVLLLVLLIVFLMTFASLR